MDKQGSGQEDNNAVGKMLFIMEIKLKQIFVYKFISSAIRSVCIHLDLLQFFLKPKETVSLFLYAIFQLHD